MTVNRKCKNKDCNLFVYDGEICKCGTPAGVEPAGQKKKVKKNLSSNNNMPVNRDYKMLERIGRIHLFLGKLLFVLFAFIGLFLLSMSFSASSWTGVGYFLLSFFVGVLAYVICILTGEIIFLFINIAKDVEKIKNKK